MDRLYKAPFSVSEHIETIWNVSKSAIIRGGAFTLIDCSSSSPHCHPRRMLCQHWLAPKSGRAVNLQEQSCANSDRDSSLRRRASQFGRAAPRTSPQRNDDHLPLISRSRVTSSSNILRTKKWSIAQVFRITSSQQAQRTLERARYGYVIATTIMADT